MEFSTKLASCFFQPFRARPQHPDGRKLSHLPVALALGTHRLAAAEAAGLLCLSMVVLAALIAGQAGASAVERMRHIELQHTELFGALLRS